MLQKEFDELCKQIAIDRRQIVEVKKPEYTEGHEDVLWNFKQTAHELNLDPMQVAYIFFRKHVASIGQVCSNRNRNSSELFMHRISDAMNYLELIYALYNEGQDVGAISIAELSSLY